MDRWSRLKLVDPPTTNLTDFASRLDIPEGEMRNLLVTIKAIDLKTDKSDLQADYRELRLKLWTPNSVVEHVERMAELCGVKVISFWQALWLETLFTYSSKLPPDVEEQVHGTTE